MNNLNSILLEGVLSRDPQLSYEPSGSPVCRFTIKVRRVSTKGTDEIGYFDVQVCNRLAEVCQEYLKKDRGLRVVGRLVQDHWQDYDGVDKFEVFILAEHVEFKPIRKQDGVEGLTVEADAEKRPVPEDDQSAKMESDKPSPTEGKVGTPTVTLGPVSGGKRG